MKVSLNEIRRLGYDGLVAAPVEELVRKIGSQLGEVEDVEYLGALYQDVIVARIVEVDKHPNADRLNICLIDDGGKDPVVERNERGLVQVVCGAPNVRPEMLVAWLPPGATVPETFHMEVPFRLEARALRGVVSHGMLASAKELALGDSHEGILEIDAEAAPGQAFATVYHLDDHIIEIENKMFTHRPDCFGLLGVAREMAGIQHQAFTSPDWYREAPDFKAGDGLKLEVDNEAPDLVPRFMALAFKDIQVGPSPLWLQSALIRLGSRPINNVVDITNYLMLLTGQPLHSYDYDKVGGKLGVRLAKPKENLALLNGKAIELNEKDVVITDGKRVIGLGGVMGGSETEVSEATKNVIIEVATFDMYAIRRTSMRHGLFTDAVTRFNKGQSPLQNDRVLSKAAELLHELCGAQIASHVLDHGAKLRTLGAVDIEAAFINDRLGLKLSAKEMASLLANVEFETEVKKDHLRVQPPFWRTDIVIAEDIVEEIGRLYGYDRLPLELPRRTLQPAPRNQLFEAKQAIRSALSRAGANEVLTYSFVHQKLLERAGQDKDEAFQLSNALSPDLQYYRLSLLPSLLDKVRPNLKAGYERFALFEIGKFHNFKLHAADDEGLPSEYTTVDLVYASKRRGEGAAYYQARRLMDQLAIDLGLELALAPIDKEPDFALTEPFDYRRSAFVSDRASGKFLGIIGELKPAVIKNFKLTETVAAFSLDVEALGELSVNAGSSYRPLPRFPGTERDVTLQLDETVHYSRLIEVIEEALSASQLISDYWLTGIYQPEDSDHKNVTIRVSLTDPTATITSDAANRAIDKLAEAAKQQLKAEQL